MSKVTAILGSKYPIIQGAMGVICNPELVAAVSEAGGFGLLATAFSMEPDPFRNNVRATKQLTNKPFGANLFVMNPHVTEFAQILAEEGVRAVTVSAGSPKNLIPLLHELDIKAIVVVPAVDVARKARDAGADAIIAEGSESGGMQGFRGASTMVLVPAIVDAISLPVIAAGGICDSRGYRAAMALGAQGIQVGTRFIASRECTAHPHYKQYITDSGETGTGLVNLGRARVRALRTPLVEKILEDGKIPDGVFTPTSVEESWIKGRLEAGLLPAGQVAGLISDIPTVQEIIEEMVRGA
ncbi:MAG: nitronate monooxygenase [Deltaproteobacteria bacterium]|nr:nitronate monooxygenase [Deltaproteobacteria bacterium]